MSNIKTIQQMVDALASIANEPDRTLQQRPVRFAKAKEAIQAGRTLLESLAKQEQGEPVAEITVKNGHWIDTTGFSAVKNLADGIHKLYTTPQQRKPLTPERALKIAAYWSSKQFAESASRFILDFTRGVEADHDIKE